jgi:hypothetical protein
VTVREQPQRPGRRRHAFSASLPLRPSRDRFKASIQTQAKEFCAIGRIHVHRPLVVGGDDRQRGVDPRARWFELSGFLQRKTRGRRGPGESQLAAIESGLQFFQRGYPGHQHRHGGNQRLAGHVERLVLRAAKAKVRRALKNDPADQMAIWREDMHAIARARPDAPIRVTLDAVGNAVVDVGKDRTTRKRVADGHGINLDAMLAGVGVGHVKFGFIRRETKPVGADDAVRDDGPACGIRIGGMELIDAIVGRVSGVWPRRAAIVAGVGEPDGAVGFHGHIIRRVKLQSIPVGHERRHDAVCEHGNLLPGTAGFRADQPFLRVEQSAVEQRVRGREQEVSEAGRRDDFLKLVVVLVAEHQVAATRYPGRPFQPDVDVGVGGEHRVRIYDAVELVCVGDLERRRAGGVKKDNPNEQVRKSLADKSAGHMLPRGADLAGEFLRHVCWNCGDWARGVQAGNQERADGGHKSAIRGQSEPCSQ